MDFWTKGRGRRPVTLVLITVVLVLGSAFVAYADSASRHPVDVSAMAQGDATPTATPVDSSANTSGAEAAVLDSTEVLTPTATPQPVCTPPACQAGEVLHCPGNCPGGCGYECVTPTPGPAANLLANASFEDGFVDGQGMGVGWGRFQNGNVDAGWYDDTWEKVVCDGKHAQLLELRDAKENDRYVGIFQTVNVVPNTQYVLTLRGLVRSDSGSPEKSDYGFRMQYGIDYTGGVDWQSTNITWIELMWDEQPRQDPTGENQYRYETHTATIKATSNKLTLFIRGWKKWADAVEGNYDLDCLSLVGQQAPGTQPTPTGSPTSTPVPGMPETGNEFAFLDNPVLVVASAALLVVLAGGAIWGLTRRRV
jgi:hypothetical protein